MSKYLYTILHVCTSDTFNLCKHVIISIILIVLYKSSLSEKCREIPMLQCINLYSGFGDAVNCEDTWKACSAYIDEQFRQYFTDESGLNRKNIQDNRVHCCLYFIPPYGHGYIQTSISVVLNLLEVAERKIAKAINLTIKTIVSCTCNDYRLKIEQPKIFNVSIVIYFVKRGRTTINQSLF